MIRFLSIVTIILLLTSCARMNVQGSFADADTSFKGNFSSSYRGKGRVFFTTDAGLLCEGKYKYNSEAKKAGTGSFTCLDRTLGEFTFTVTLDPRINGSGIGRRTGKGVGKTSEGERFTFKLKG